MKNIYIILFLSLLTNVSIFGQDEYYFGGKGELDASIPTPESFFGFNIGQALVRYDKVIEYFNLLADASDRVSLEVLGTTYEGRQQVALIITSPENQQNLEQIRQKHLKLVDPDASVDIADQKIVVHLGYNVHGGEIAGTDASVVTAYYLVASQDPEILEALDESVIFVEPALNPDGRDRAANYINGFHSSVPVADPVDQGHNGGSVPHRGNHFWTDLNRDWLPLAHVESQNRVAFYHKWYPNIFMDFHEMGSGSSYYFEPSPLNTWDSSIPQSTYEVLHVALAKYFSKALDEIGSLYFTKEVFTNLFPIYGSTYPDFQGGAGTTLEVGSTSGVEIETDAGIRTFSRNIKDNFEVGLASVRAALKEKEVFLRHQKEFFESAVKEGGKSENQYVVFGSENDKSINRIFLNHLLQHQIKVYELKEDFSQDGKDFKPGSAYVIPYKQAQFYLLNSIFSERTEFEDPAFMDISAPSTAYGFGVPFVKVKQSLGEGAAVTSVPGGKGKVENRSDYAYAFEYRDYLAPKTLYYLQKKGVKPRVAQKSFTASTSEGPKEFSRGSIVIPVHYQEVEQEKLYGLLEEAASLSGITIHAIQGGLSLEGIDLGSNNIRVVKKPVVATVTESGYNWTSVGELWALLSERFGIPLTKITERQIENADIHRYTSIVLSGAPGFSPEFVNRLTAWVENGGTLITTGPASDWAVRSGLATGFVPDTAQTASDVKDYSPYSRFSHDRIGGAVLKASLNLEHPLAYGFEKDEFFTLKTRAGGFPQPLHGDGVVLQTTSGDPVDGYIPEELRPKLEDNRLIVSVNRGRGAIVLFSESPTFRGYYLAPGRILTNAIFFGAGDPRWRRW